MSQLPEHFWIEVMMYLSSPDRLSLSFSCSFLNHLFYSAVLWRSYTVSLTKKTASVLPSILNHLHEVGHHVTHLNLSFDRFYINNHIENITHLFEVIQSSSVNISKLSLSYEDSHTSLGNKTKEMFKSLTKLSSLHLVNWRDCDNVIEIIKECLALKNMTEFSFMATIDFEKHWIDASFEIEEDEMKEFIQHFSCEKSHVLPEKESEIESHCEEYLNASSIRNAQSFNNLKYLS